MRLTELLKSINEEYNTDFGVGDLKLDEDYDLWLYDPEQKTGIDLCRDTGNGWVIVYEDWGNSEVDEYTLLTIVNEILFEAK